MQVVDNNEPGGGTTIRIRGATSVNASSDPLYVIDGMPLGTGAGRRALRRPRPAQLPEPERHREHHGAEGRVGRGDLRRERRQRRGAHHDEVGRRASAGARQVEYRLQRLRLVRRQGNPAVLSAAQFRRPWHSSTRRRASRMLGTANTNWFDLIERTAYGQEQNLSVTNSTARTRSTACRSAT